MDKISDLLFSKVKGNNQYTKYGPNINTFFQNKNQKLKQPVEHCLSWCLCLRSAHVQRTSYVSILTRSVMSNSFLTRWSFTWAWAWLKKENCLSLSFIYIYQNFKARHNNNTQEIRIEEIECKFLPSSMLLDSVLGNS